MPHHADDNWHPHLPLMMEIPTPDRRKRPAPPQPPPDRGTRTKFAAEVRGRLDDMEEEIRRRERPPAGLHPHLVFRVPLSKSASPQQVVEMLKKIDVDVVAIESDKAVIGFRDEADLSRFRDAVNQYEKGPGFNQQTGEQYRTTQWDVLEHIETPQMQLLGREDRIGTRLAARIGENGHSIVLNELYYIDLELWHRGTDALARQAVQEIEQFIAASPEDGERICDRFSGQLLCLVKVAVRGSKLNQLLNLDIVAEAELPPQPYFDHRQAQRTPAKQFPTPPASLPDGPSVCVLDSGVNSNHPLLVNNFGHAESIATTNATAADENGHGTMVGGLAVFGDIRACYESGSFSSPITLYSARVLNSDNRFDQESLILHQMRRAIEVFISPPYSCRVFNLSLGDEIAWFSQNKRQSLWAESLDILAREYDVLLIVSAGNHNLGVAGNASDAEEIVLNYPEFLFDPECRLCEPATAAIAITVGGIAGTDTPAIPSVGQINDLRLPIAQALQPSPTTRIGPGINDAIKPEFVAPSGNTTFTGFSTLRQVDDDPGLAVMSFSHTYADQLFAFDIGTSYAAPVVARSAAILLKHLEEQLSEVPQANLVRAILAASAVVPQPAVELLQNEYGEEGIRKVCGYGMIDDEFALNSGDRRVTQFHQGSIALDTFQIFEVPIPDEFRNAVDKKTMTITLAFDPPVRSRRAEYLGVKMSYSLIRGKSLEEIVDAYRALSSEEKNKFSEIGEKAQGTFQSPYLCKLKPGPNALQGSTLQRSSWTFSSSKAEYGENYFLVVQARRGWAPETFTEQNFAVSVTLEANEPRLYNLIQQRIQLRQRTRFRSPG